jgi:LEA14-like dessication related protein
MLVAAVLLSGCIGQVVQKPTVSVDAIEITALSLRQLDLDVQITISNPNPVGGTLDEIAFDLYFVQGAARRYLGHGESTDVSIPADGDAEVIIPVSVDNLGLISAVFTAAGQGEIEFVVEGSGSLVIGGFSFEIPFEETQVVTL